MRLIILLFLILPTSLFAFENTKVKINNFYIQKYEVTIAEYLNFANKTNFKTEAEKQGFGYEYGMGWEKRKNWNYKTPYGKNSESLTGLSNPQILEIAQTLNQLFRQISNQKTDFSKKLNLPQLVVVGTQSSGKSTIVNRFIGMEVLPVGDNMVTRTPINIRLTTTSNLSPCKIRRRLPSAVS
mgnify:CR=1 FL=1